MSILYRLFGRASSTAPDSSTHAESTLSVALSDVDVALMARKMAAETLAEAYLRDEPGMEPQLAKKLRAKMATDCPEVFERIQELSGDQK
jgi:hypothetical protein